MPKIGKPSGYIVRALKRKGLGLSSKEVMAIPRYKAEGGYLAWTAHLVSLSAAKGGCPDKALGSTTRPSILVSLSAAKDG